MRVIGWLIVVILFKTEGIDRCHLIILQSLVKTDTLYKDLHIAQYNK